MFGKIGEETGIEMVLPIRTIEIGAPAEQRIWALAIPTEDIDLVRRWRGAELHRLERQGRQFDEGVAGGAAAGTQRRRSIGDCPRK